jgi:hypothetical protein
MKNLILSIATGLALTLAVTPSFAAAKSGGHPGTENQTAAERSGGSYGESCGAILANKSGYTRDQVQACE